MRLPRVFHPRARPGRKVRLGPEYYMHLVRVLRRESGSLLEVADGAGGLYLARLAEISGRDHRVEIEVIERREPVEQRLQLLSIAAAIPKGDGLEAAIRSASETGMEALLPLITERTVSRPAPGSAKVDRWRRIARESAEQCGRAKVLEVFEPQAWDEFLTAPLWSLPPAPPPSAEEPLGDAPGDVPGDGSDVWIAVPGGPHPREAGILSALEAGRSTGVVIGPEGGFSPRELEAAEASGMLALGFPTPILKTPTAVMYVAALGSLVQEGG